MTTSGIEYLNSHNIKWFPVFMDIIDGNKKLRPYPDGTMPKYNTDFNNEELIKHRQSTYKDKTNTIWMDTTDVQHIDIDSEEAHQKYLKAKEQHPYFLSVRKGLPHYFFNLTDKSRHQKRVQLDFIHKDMEILNGQVSYASMDFKVYNPDKEIQEVDVPLPEQTQHNDNKSFMKTDTIYELLDIISVDYIDNFNTWIRLGASLYNCGYDMEVFDNFSKRSKKYGGVSKLWNDFSKNEMEQVGFGTICYYAKESNPTKWETIKYKLQSETQKSEIDKFLQSGNSITHSTVAKIFFEAFNEKYVYSNGSWFELTEGGIYIKLDKDAITIISKDIKQYIQKFIFNVIENESDENKRKSLWKAEKDIESNTFKKNCVEEAKQDFINRNLYEELNKDQTLMGFKNGIFDLKTGTFRKGLVADKVSMTTGYDYKHEVNHENIQFLEDLFDGYFSCKDTAHYFKKHLGSLLEGGNKEEKCYFWVGSGRNGKGTTDTMLRMSLGNYYQNLKNEFFTIADKNSNQAHPEIVDLENCRVSMTHEPEGTTKYLTSKFKNLSGGDPLKGRDLYESKSHEFKPTFKPVIQTNHLPQFTDCDFGLLQRLAVIYFPYCFVDSPTKANEKQIDIELKQKLENMNMDFFHFLAKYYKLYKSEGLKEPKEIVSSISEYKKDIDSVKTFMSEAVIQTNEPKDNISSVELLQAHNNWSINKLDRNRFAKRLGATGFELKQKKINGTNKKCVVGVKWNTDFKEELESQPLFLDDNL